MTSYIIRKILYGLAVLWGVVTLVFFLFNIVPGDPVRMMLGQRADEADVQAIREELGLNQSVFKQYTDYLNDLSPLSFYKCRDAACHIQNDKYDNFKSNMGDVLAIEYDVSNSGIDMHTTQFLVLYPSHSTRN